MSVRKVRLRDKEKLEELANRYLVELYGDQSKALRGWLTGYNYKHAWVYETNEKSITGLIVVSAKPTKDYVKLSTFIVRKEYQNKGIGKLLLDKALYYTKESEKGELSVTVGEDITDSLNFFYGHNFKLKKELPDKYRKGKKELVLVRVIK